VVFTLVMPVVFFLLFGLDAAYAEQDAGHGNVAAYIMISMAVYGAMLATTGAGASVSLERSLGWSRQLRLTPLAPAAYIAVKLVMALVVGLASILAVYAAGVFTDKAEMPVHLWVETALVAWVGSLVFAAFGLFMGYVLPGENVMQILGPGLALLAFLGGLFVPLDKGSVMETIAKLTPMYGLNQLVHAPLTGDAVQPTWLLNVAAWLVVFAGGAMWRFRKDTARV
jgi:ABC-2 type transport system permease protein